MGVDAEDIDGDGLPELFVTNFQNEYNTLYSNLGGGTFLDATSFIGLAADSLPWVGWGLRLADFDSDGWPDCFVTNGHVDDNRRALGQPIDYAEPPLLHRNVPLDRPRTASAGSSPEQGRWFRLATRDVGPYFAATHVGRGAAFGDLDDDGDLDIVVSHKDGPPAVLRNDTPRRTAGSGSSSSAPAAIATPSAPGWRWRSRGGRSTASAREVAASSRRTTRGSSSDWARRLRWPA